jgi:hypothetical protein
MLKPLYQAQFRVFEGVRSAVEEGVSEFRKIISVIMKMLIQD